MRPRAKARRTGIKIHARVKDWIEANRAWW